MQLVRCLTVGVALALASTSCSRDSEPGHGGKPLSYWHRQLLDRDKSVSEPASTALVQLGPLAVPGLLKQLDNPSYRTRILQTLANMGDAASAAEPYLLVLVERESGVAQAKLCHCLTYMLPANGDGHRAMLILNGLVKHIDLCFRGKDWAKLEHDVRYVATMESENKSILQVVSWGVSYSRSELVRQDCIRALGRGACWGAAAIEPLETVLNDGDGPDVAVALEALQMHKNLPPSVVKAALRLLKAPTGAAIEPKGTIMRTLMHQNVVSEMIENPDSAEARAYALDFLTLGSTAVHRRAAKFLKTQGSNIVSECVKVLRESGEALEQASKSLAQIVRVYSMPEDGALDPLEYRYVLERLAALREARGSCRRLASLLRDLGDEGETVLKNLHSTSLQVGGKSGGSRHAGGLWRSALGSPWARPGR